MDYTLGAEETQAGRWIGWVFDLPGCTTYGRTREEALARAPEQIAAFLAWQERHGDSLGPLFNTEPVGVNLFETVYAMEGDADSIGNSRAFFEDDRPPLKKSEVEQAIKLLNYSRGELLALIQDIPLEHLQAPIEGEPRDSLANVLEHLAWAEWWYMDRMNMSFNREDMPEDPRAKLNQVRVWTISRLRDLIGQKNVTKVLGEQWSGRKVIRRAIWHELDHIAHIAELLNGQISPNGRYVEL